ncbi:hypothetical protein [Sphingobium sp. BYY-5]|nr:hypothetical protein [Sphingobium sp. BYY-5]
MRTINKEMHARAAEQRLRLRVGGTLLCVIALIPALNALLPLR